MYPCCFYCVCCLSGAMMISKKSTGIHPSILGSLLHCSSSDIIHDHLSTCSYCSAKTSPFSQSLARTTPLYLLIRSNYSCAHDKLIIFQLSHENCFKDARKKSGQEHAYCKPIRYIGHFMTLWYLTLFRPMKFSIKLYTVDIEGQVGPVYILRGHSLTGYNFQRTLFSFI